MPKEEPTAWNVNVPESQIAAVQEMRSNPYAMKFVAGVCFVMWLALIVMGVYTSVRTKVEEDDGYGGLPFELILKARVFYSSKIRIGFWYGAAMFCGSLFFGVTAFVLWTESNRKTQGYKQVPTHSEALALKSNVEELVTTVKVAEANQDADVLVGAVSLNDIMASLTYWLIFWGLLMIAGVTDGFTIMFASGCVFSSCMFQLAARFMGRTIEAGKISAAFKDSLAARLTMWGIILCSGMAIVLLVIPLWMMWMSYYTDQQVSGRDFKRGDVLTAANSLFTAFAGLACLFNTGHAVLNAKPIWDLMPWMSIGSWAKWIAAIPFYLMYFIGGLLFGNLADMKWFIVYYPIANSTMLLAIPVMVWRVVWTIWPDMATLPET